MLRFKRKLSGRVSPQIIKIKISEFSNLSMAKTVNGACIGVHFEFPEILTHSELQRLGKKISKLKDM